MIFCEYEAVLRILIVKSECPRAKGVPGDIISRYPPHTEVSWDCLPLLSSLIRLLKPLILKITRLIDAVKILSASLFEGFEHDAAGFFQLHRLVKGCNHCNAPGKAQGEDCPIFLAVCIPVMELYLALVIR